MKKRLIIGLVFLLVLGTVSFSLARGKREVNILQWQQLLKDTGYIPGKIDGVMNEETKNSVIKFQTDHGLESNGELNNETWEKLNVLLSEKLEKDKAEKKEKKIDKIRKSSDLGGKGK
jgi:peptidoglycan hydrolase-like protein with peptidoglycan-binding domain